ncbi:MAG: hypothetical protein H6622_04710 [Halobacteriovoraceae bacterium]|nr:hypothetical protein [Halobacteriovoraceae bacterium]
MKFSFCVVFTLISLRIYGNPFSDDLNLKPFFTVSDLSDGPQERSLFIYVKKNRNREILSEMKTIRTLMGKYGRIKHFINLGEIQIYDKVENIKKIISYLEGQEV